MRRRRLPIVPLLALVLLAWPWGRAPEVTLGTFNIRMFLDERTDPGAVAGALAELDADAFAVQEIRDLDAFAAVLRDASARTGRDYVMAMAPYCDRNPATRALNIGAVYDRSRLELVARRPFSDGACARDQPQGLLAVLRRDGHTFGLASLHMTAGGTPAAHASRRAQWAWLVEALPRWRRAFDVPVVLSGDFNSTGYLEQSDERAFIDRTVADHGLHVATRDLGCSMYWEPAPGRFEVSLLDHMIATDGLTLTDAGALGMCASLRCAPQREAPTDYHAVSDHCPVRAILRP